MPACQTSHESVRPLPHAQFKAKSLPPGHQIRQHLAGQLLIVMHSENNGTSLNIVEIRIKGMHHMLSTRFSLWQMIDCT